MLRGVEDGAIGGLIGGFFNLSPGRLAGKIFGDSTLKFNEEYGLNRIQNDEFGDNAITIGDTVIEGPDAHLELTNQSCFGMPSCEGFRHEAMHMDQSFGLGAAYLLR